MYLKAFITCNKVFKNINETQQKKRDKKPGQGLYVLENG